MFKWGCFVHSNGKNWEVLNKKLIFYLFLGLNVGI